MATQVRETDATYNPSSCFETFPFPNRRTRSRPKLPLRQRNFTSGGTLAEPAGVDQDGSVGVSGLGGWPWARYVVEPDARGIGTVRWPRIVPKDADCAASLSKRTLTNLYNQRPAWLDLADKKLDEAVFAAYGWDTGMSDDDLLAKLRQPGVRVRHLPLPVRIRPVGGAAYHERFHQPDDLRGEALDGLLEGLVA